MQNKVDYVVSDKARTLGSTENPGMKFGTFVGTKKYFFFFPDQIEDADLMRRKLITTTLSFEGLKMKEFIKTKLEDYSLKVDEFEEFALDMSGANKFIEAFPFSEIKQINFLAGNITMNKTDKRIGGWDVIFTSVGKQKKDVKEFYSTNPIV